MTDSSALSTTKRICAYCASEMPVRATVCANCNMTTSKTKNNLSYLAGLIGPLGLIAGAVIFGITNFDNMRRVVHPYRGIQLLDMQAGLYHSSIFISNVGDTPIFVSTLWVTSNIVRQQFDFHQVIEPNQVSTMIQPADPAHQNLGAYVTSPDGSVPENIIHRRTDGSLYGFDEKCYLFEFFSSNTTAVENMNAFYKAAGQKLAVVPSKITAYYFNKYSAQRQETTFDGLILLLSKKVPECSR